MKNRLQILCSMGEFPLQVISHTHKVEGEIRMHDKFNTLIFAYHKIGEREIEEDKGMYLNDLNIKIIESLYPSDSKLRVEFYKKVRLHLK